MVVGGIVKFPAARSIVGMAAEMKKNEYAHYTHNDRRLPLWSKRDIFQYMYARPWHRISDFYLDLVCRGGGHSSLHSLFSSEKNNSKVALECSHGDDESNLVNASLKERNRRWERKTFKIVLSYHGGSFDGWQKQAGLNTVQGIVEKSLGKFVDEDKAQQLKEKSLPVEGCVSVAGRTDKGVSALQQVCSFYTWRKDVKCSDMMDAINASAPGKLKVLFISEVSRVFHPTFAAKWRRYFYIFPLEGSAEIQVSDNHKDYSSRNCENDELQQQTEHIVHGDCLTFDSENNYLDDAQVCMKSLSFSVDKVNQLLCQLEGKSLSYGVFARDTKASRNAGPPTECFIFHARAVEAKLPCINKDVTEEMKVMCVELVANRFLRKMVRVLVATAIREAAAGADANALLNLMDTACRRTTAPPAPPDGLCLVDVGYTEFDQENCLIL